MASQKGWSFPNDGGQEAHHLLGSTVISDDDHPLKAHGIVNARDRAMRQSNLQVGASSALRRM
jgi:hypothetical protein